MSLSSNSANKTFPFFRYVVLNGYTVSPTISPDNTLVFGASNWIAFYHSTHPYGSTQYGAVTMDLAVGQDEFSMGSFFSASTSLARGLAANNTHYVYQSAPSSSTTVTSGTAWRAAAPHGFTSPYSGVVTESNFYHVMEFAPTASAYFDYCRSAMLAGNTEVPLTAQVKTSSVSGTIFSSVMSFSLVLPVIYDKSLL